MNNEKQLAFIDEIAKDLKKEFPDTCGFSRINLFSMRKFYLFYYNSELVHQLGGQIENESENAGNQKDKMQQIIEELQKRWSNPESEIQKRIKSFKEKSPDVLGVILGEE